jgi:uncharacterized membrane protein (DUF2068 family)
VKNITSHNSDKGVLLIAVWKLLKAALLIALGFGALSLVHRDAQEVLTYRIDQLRVDPDNRYIQRFLEYVGVLSPKTIRAYGIGFFFYGALYVTEGIGLLRMKRWAEWFTVIVTSSFLLLEIYSFVKHDGLLKLLAIIANLAIVIYLIFRIRHPADQK